MFSRLSITRQLRRCSVQSRVLPCGSKATGTFSGDMLTEGTLLAADGTKRSGKFIEGLLSQGSVKLPDGRVYVGVFVGGVPREGVLHDEGCEYEGQFNEQWQREGDGIERYSDGSVHQGTFRSDWLCEGKVTLPQNANRKEVQFEGKLSEGKFVHGTLWYDDMKYIGALQSNNPHGKGRLELPDGSVREGNFQAGLLHGVGKLIFKNGTFLSGDFEHGALHSGSIKWVSGDLYEGDLDEKHRPHGDGAMFKAAERHWWSGQWVHGTFSGGSVTDDDGAPIDYRTVPPNTAL